MPRRSATPLSVVSPIGNAPRIPVPTGLSKDERELFGQLIVQCSPDHFARSDAPLIVAYVQAVLLSRKAFNQASKDAAALPTWERAAKTMATLATKLRLCPHSRPMQRQ
jgi:hypothetical protein